MLKIREELKIYLYSYPTDMRKAINGLAALVMDELGFNPSNGAVYIFWNHKLDRVKILFYDRNGFVLYYKILTKKQFSIIRSQTSKYHELTIEQLDWLLAGLDVEILQDFPELNYSYFY